MPSKQNKKKNIKLYFFYVFTLFCSLIPLILIYNSCGGNQLTQKASQGAEGNGTNNPPPPNSQVAPKTQTGVIPSATSDTTSSVKKIDFLFIVETSYATARSIDLRNLTLFLSSITSNPNLDARIAITRSGTLDGNFLVGEQNLNDNFLYPFGAKNYINSNSQNSESILLSLENAFNDLSNHHRAENRDAIRIPPIQDLIEQTLIELENADFPRGSRTPLEMILISAIDIPDPGRTGPSLTAIADDIVGTLRRKRVHEFRLHTITTMDTNCSRQTELPISNSLRLQLIAEDISPEGQSNVIDICSSRPDYNINFTAILNRHNLPLDLENNPRSTSPDLLVTLQKTPALGYPIRIEYSENGSTWTNLPLETTTILSGNTLSVSSNLLSPGTHYKIHYFYRQITNPSTGTGGGGTGGGTGGGGSGGGTGGGTGGGGTGGGG